MAENTANLLALQRYQVTNYLKITVSSLYNYAARFQKMYRNLDPCLRQRMRKFDLLGISWKNRTDLCIVLKASLTFFSTSSELIAFNGSFIQLSCHRNQSETVIHKFRNGSNSFTSLDSFSYYNDKCRAATITSITHCAFCKRCHDNQATLSYNTKGYCSIG